MLVSPFNVQHHSLILLSFSSHSLCVFQAIGQLVNVIDLHVEIPARPQFTPMVMKELPWIQRIPPSVTKLTLVCHKHTSFDFTLPQLAHLVKLHTLDVALGEDMTPASIASLTRLPTLRAVALRTILGEGQSAQATTAYLSLKPMTLALTPLPPLSPQGLVLVLILLIRRHNMHFGVVLAGLAMSNSHSAMQ